MEDLLINIIKDIVDNFNLAFCVTVNIITYLVISIISDFNHNIKVTTWTKRIIFLIISILIGIFYYTTGSDITIIFNSIILAPVSWSWIFKPICKKLNIDYSKVINSNKR